MNRDFQAKFLMHLNGKKKADEGFTLIELLVVIIIIGILAAIALPSLLGQANKAKQAEARNNIGATNRAQQGFFLEAGRFATSFPELAVGISTQTDNYRYTMDPATGTPGVTVAIADPKAVNTNSTLKAYYGVTGTIPGDSNTGELLTVGLLCEGQTPKIAAITNVGGASFNSNSPACATNYKSLK
ncbi:MAG: type IV pilin-like G/H family protein [Jaaginema sp. PMC 1079.18]|nr:type IV pilin-like G/H family protein [Jaaginema sp. PMC 1080.18]MEC4853855.1 type IV pilin-like G/H family protein [Jaaginema sp. PMC 1079.18]MEC4868716.1 type IV pilin-like G/H family protein [Jaaginema sp. PMC 1078.18]